ncbi:MAG: acyl-homoserine-lactone synthase TraI [Pseudorhizobium sp.]
MQVIAISGQPDLQQTELLEQHHRLRARVFSDRLGWDVNVIGGRETDAFDALQPTYILALSDQGDVLGCARLLPATGPTMLREVFPSLLPEEGLRAHPAMIESSRFCVDTTTAGGGGGGGGIAHQATLIMFTAIIEWCLVNGYTEIITVTDLRFERILARVGWPLRRLAEPRRIGVTLALAGTLQADRNSFLALRPPRYRSQISPSGNQAA